MARSIRDPLTATRMLSLLDSHCTLDTLNPYISGKMIRNFFDQFVRCCGLHVVGGSLTILVAILMILLQSLFEVGEYERKLLLPVPYMDIVQRSNTDTGARARNMQCAK